MTFCILTGIEEIISESEPNLVVLVVTTELFIGGGGGAFRLRSRPLGPPIYTNLRNLLQILYSGQKKMPHEKYSLVRFMFLQEENEKQDDQIAKTKNSDLFFF